MRCCLPFFVCSLLSFRAFFYSRYANASKTIQCTPCGTSGASAKGATFCGQCDAGQFMLNQVCTDCPAGWASVYGEKNCTECGIGKYANTIKQATSCSACVAGTYSEQKQQTSVVTCLDCPKGRYSSATGLGSLKLCKWNDLFVVSVHLPPQDPHIFLLSFSLG